VFLAISLNHAKIRKFQFSFYYNFFFINWHYSPRRKTTRKPQFITIKFNYSVADMITVMRIYILM
jgi:hypothetical protein